MACAKLQEAFYGCTVRPLLIDEPMSRHTSFKIGGPADLLATPSNEEELCKLLARAKEHNIPVTLVGNGSNLLVRDKGIRGLVIKLGNMLNTIEVGENSITFGSGVSLALASKKAAELGFTGMEFAVGIPNQLCTAVEVVKRSTNGGKATRNCHGEHNVAFFVHPCIFGGVFIVSASFKLIAEGGFVH